MNEIVYKPNAKNTWVNIVLLVCSIVLLVFVALSILQNAPRFGISMLLIMLGASYGIVCSIIYIRDVKITLIVDHYTIQVLEARTPGYKCINWEDTRYTYYSATYRGYTVLLLSSRELSIKEVKRLVNKRDFFTPSAVIIDDVILLMDNNCAEMTAIKELAESKTSVISYLDK